MRKFLTSLIAGALALSLVACGGKKEEVSAAATEAEKENAAGSELAAMIISIPQGDPFLTLAYAGVEKMGVEYGIETKIIEALDKSEYSEQVRAMAEAGANPIYVVWDDLAVEAVKIASDFPDTKFIIVDCYVEGETDNVKTINVEPQEAAFIAGVVASKTTKTKQVSWIGSADQPVIRKFRAGFEAGVKYGDPSVTCESLYIGDANDPNKGSELTKQVIGKGADVVMHSANKAGLGVIRACEESGVKAIGADEWQGAVNEEIVFWSALKDITGATYEAGKSVMEGTFKPGLEINNINSGLKLYDDRDYDKLPDDVKKAVDEAVEKMKSGEIEVPSDIE